MKKYSELLKDGRWQIRKSEIMAMDNFCCQRCGKSAKNGVTLNVHHKKYRKGAMPWEYGDDELVTLCEQCHRYAHMIDEQEKEPIYIAEKQAYDFGLKVGDFVYFSHSDFDDYGIVYHVDNVEQFAMAVFVDNGSNFNSMWFAKIGSDLLVDDSYDLRTLEYIIFDGSGLDGWQYIESVADFFYDVKEKNSLSKYSLYEITELHNLEGEIKRISRNYNIIIANNEELQKYLNYKSIR